MRHKNGYSLIELLLAMAMFSALSTGLIALLARSSDFLSSGASQTETMDSIQTFAGVFGSDVAAMASRADAEEGRPDVRLLADFADCDLNGDKKTDLLVQRLFFVRSAPPMWNSGLEVGAKDWFNQIDDEKKVNDGTLKATGGLMEVFWLALPESLEDPAVMQIWRGYRSPIGGEGTLLPVKGGRDGSATLAERGVANLVDVRARAKPVLSGVLYFGVEFWARRTTTWDTKVRARDGGPLLTWDSTRGILPLGDDFGSFPFSKISGPGDETSLNDPTDDTYPRKVRVTCVVEELGRNARVGILDDDFPADAKAIPCTDTRFFPATDTAQRYVKIDAEWMEVGVPSGGVIPVVRRGVRGTSAVAHRSGSKVHHGRSFVQEYDIATFRDAYRDELSSRTGR